MADNALNNENAGANAPVDFTWLRECTDNDADAMKALLDMYFTRTNAMLDEIEKAIAAGTAVELRRLAHSCVGSSGTCGMVKLTPLFKQLEKKGVAGTVDGAADIAAQARSEFGRAQEFVSRTVKS
jgi:HPt (histidine-containing phosphotransfer) domain-containing protein